MKSDVETVLGAFDQLSANRLVVTDRDELAPWETDWRGRWTGRAMALVQPATVAEVQAVVRIATEHRVALVPQGGNTSMVGGATPSSAGDQLVLSLRRLAAIRSIGAERATAEAGVVLQRLHDAAEGEGVRFPLTLGARGSATVGGLVSTGAGGTQVLRHGTMRSLVLGLEVVLANGTMFSSLRPLVKDSRGPDLTPLFVGAEGTLGIVTAATLRLVPKPVDRAVAWLAVETPADALAVLRRLEARLPEKVEGFELISRASLAAVLAHRKLALSPIHPAFPWHVVVEAVGGGEVRNDLAGALGDEALLLGAALAQSEAQADAMWAIRDELSSVERAHGPNLSFDLSVPVEALPAFVAEAERDVPAAFPGHSVSGFGHLGDGNLHLHVRAPGGVDRQRWTDGEGPAISRWMHDRIVTAGGSISAEHGIGQMKRAEHARLTDPTKLTLLAAIKGALDPHGILNPGKLHP